MPSPEALVAAYEALADSGEPLADNMYLVMANAMRSLGEPEDEIFEHLRGVAQGRCDDENVVVEAIYGDGEVLRPSDPF